MKENLLAGACLILLACQQPKLVKTLPPDVRVDTFLQQSASKIDVLWVIDNSGSMAPRQENLAKNFQAFIDVFSRGSIDFRIAVTTTDIFKDRGQFKGTPRILTPTTPQIATAFATNVRVGTSGSPYEAGLQAATMALDLQATNNLPRQKAEDTCNLACKGDGTCITGCAEKNEVEFLRPTAYLYLIFVTDEEDKSTEDVRYYWRTFETAKGIGNDGTVTTAAIMGDVPTNPCGAAAGVRYKALSDLTGGEVGSICDTDFSATLKKLADNAVGLKRKFALGKKPNVSTISVTIKYPCDVAADVLGACASTDKTACTSDVAANAVELVCTPKQGGADGWTYEEASQVIFFAGESVPFLKGQVEVQYYEEGKGP